MLRALILHKFLSEAEAAASRACSGSSAWLLQEKMMDRFVTGQITDTPLY